MANKHVPPDGTYYDVATHQWLPLPPAPAAVPDPAPDPAPAAAPAKVSKEK